MRIRIYERQDGTLRVNYPTPSHQRVGESESAFVARIATEAESRDPTLQGLAWVDVEQPDLPRERLRPNPSGRPLNVRAAWRLVGGRVVVDESKVREIARGPLQ